MKVLAIGGSTSNESINRQLANYAASLINGAEVMAYDFSNYDLPIYSPQREAADGIPSQAAAFAELIDSTDLLVVSLAEHNGSYSAGFKNLVDWTSRIQDRKAWGGKPMLLLATSPGGRGGATVLAAAKVSTIRIWALTLRELSVCQNSMIISKMERLATPRKIQS